MKFPLHKAAFFAALILFGGTRVRSEESGPVIDTSVIGTITAETKETGPTSNEVTSTMLRSASVFKTTELAVPIEATLRPDTAADKLIGFRTGFGITPIINGTPTILDTVKITGATCRVYKLNVATGEETLVENGEINPTVFGIEANPASPRPCVTALGNVNCGGLPRSTQNASILNTEVPNSGTLVFTKQAYMFGPALPEPTLNQGYVIRWTVSFIGTEAGLTYPEVTVNTAYTYKVVSLVQPELVHILPIHGATDGAVARIAFKGSWARFAKLQISEGKNMGSWTGSPGFMPGPTQLPDGSYEWRIHSTTPGPFFRLKWVQYPVAP